ncbi:MAG: LCP family protein [Eubacteriales bacterium]|nr:LCP family protein [Eubacteriales bacterium]
MRRKNNNNRRTANYEGMKYSPELIRKLEDPEYAKAALEYERQARSKKIMHKETGLEVKQPESGRRSQTKGKRKKRYIWNKGRTLKNLVILLLIVALVVTGCFFWLTRNFDKVDTSKEDFSIDNQVATDLRGYRNIAILGVDARADEGYDGSRTDAIIIMSIKKSTKDVRLISVMRDSYLRMEYFDNSMILDKITHAHHYAGGVNTCAALNRSLDLNIDEFVIFNWKAVSDMVDCLGGVNIDVKTNEIADLNKWGGETAENVGGIYNTISEPGRQKLDGVQAVTYCRIRKTSGGDQGRSIRYKKLMSAVVKKAVMQPWKLNKLSDTVLPNIRTNMSQIQLYTMCLGFPLYDFNKSINWPKDYYSGYLSDGLSYVVPTTLESNVKRLHRLAFKQENYQLSDTCAQINLDIINDTGIQ